MPHRPLLPSPSALTTTHEGRSADATARSSRRTTRLPERGNGALPRSPAPRAPATEPPKQNQASVAECPPPKHKQATEPPKLKSTNHGDLKWPISSPISFHCRMPHRPLFSPTPCSDEAGSKHKGGNGDGVGYSDDGFCSIRDIFYIIWNAPRIATA